MIRISLAFLMLFIFNCFIFSQYQNVSIVSGYDANEPSISINPLNTNQVVAGVWKTYMGTDTSHSSYFYSTNGGLNWQGGPMLSTIVNPGGDPCVFTDADGNFYFLCLSNYYTPYFLDYLVCFKSTNGGANWNNGVLFAYNSPKDQDKEWGCADLTNSPFRNNIYVFWTQFDGYLSSNPSDSSNIMFSKSTDHGESFSTLRKINKQAGLCNDSSNTVEGTSPCIGPNGEIYVIWAGWSKIYMDKSIDGGLTWLDNDLIVAQQVGGWDYSGVYPSNGMPTMACDLSNGPHRGTLYVCWIDQRTAINDQNIWLIKSVDGGLNWSAPVKVTNDPPNKNQFLVSMTLDKVSGYLYFVFYDRRNYTNVYQADVYAAQSTDGGNTFLNIKISSNPVNSGYNWLGDYIDIRAYNNKVRPIWVGSYNTIFTTIIDSFYSIGIQKISNELPTNFSLSQNYPNPFNPITHLRFEISELRFVELKIYDILGREITTLVNEKLTHGTYEVSWDATNYPSGVYFYKLIVGDNTTNGGFNETKKMVLVK